MVQISPLAAWCSGNALVSVALHQPRYERPESTVDFGWVKTPVLFFSICRPTFTKLGTMYRSDLSLQSPFTTVRFRRGRKFVVLVVGGRAASY